MAGALLTDGEMLAPDEWIDYPDPFGDWHEDPCTDSADAPADEALHDTTDGGRP